MQRGEEEGNAFGPSSALVHTAERGSPARSEASSRCWTQARILWEVWKVNNSSEWRSHDWRAARGSGAGEGIGARPPRPPLFCARCHYGQMWILWETSFADIVPPFTNARQCGVAPAKRFTRFLSTCHCGFPRLGSWVSNLRLEFRFEVTITSILGELCVHVMEFWSFSGSGSMWSLVETNPIIF